MREPQNTGRAGIPWSPADNPAAPDTPQWWQVKQPRAQLSVALGALMVQLAHEMTSVCLSGLFCIGKVI